MRRYINTLFSGLLLSGALSTVAMAQYWPNNDSPEDCLPGQSYVTYAGCVDGNFPPPSIDPDTTFFVATPANIPGEMKTYAVNSDDIDALLGQLPTVSNTVTRDLARDAFEEIESVRENLGQQLKTLILDIDGIDQVGAVNVGARPLKLSVTQRATSLDLELSGLSVLAAGVVSEPQCFVVCTRARGGISLNNLVISLSYDVNTGEVSNANLDFDPVVDFDLSGFAGAIAEIFFDVDAFALDAINDGIPDITNSVNMIELFSIRNTLEELRLYADIVQAEVDTFPSSVTIDPTNFSPLLDDIPSVTVVNPLGENAVANLINDVVTQAQMTVDNFQGTSLRLDVVLDSNIGVTGKGTIGITVSHASPRINSAMRSGNSVTLNVTQPAQTRRVMAFDAVSRRSFNPAISSPASGQVVVVGESSLINGLYSFPSNTVTVTGTTPSDPYNPYGPYGPYGPWSNY